jgi:WhiB family transcriptional regulator, redox-sensing transcriptional regulator
MADLSWLSHAGCAGMDPELFFPLDGGLPKAAAAACASCPVRSKCLDDAAGNYFDWLNGGVRGGLSERQRAKMRRPDVSARVSA